MNLTTQNIDAIAIKKLSGKVHTQQNFGINEESISTNIQESYSTVFAQPIEKLPVTNSGYTTLYASNGIIERVKFQLDIIPDTLIATGRSQGYKMKLPSDYNTFGKLYPTFSGGTYLYNGLGRLQIIPSIYGKLKSDGTTEYDGILYQTNGSTVISKFDPIHWYIDTYSGVLFIQDPPSGYDASSSRPGYFEAFLYVGKYVNDIIDSPFTFSKNVIITASTTLTTSNDIVYCNTSAGAFNVTLPASPINGKPLSIEDTGNGLTNNITILGNGHNIDAASSFLINTSYGGVTLTYSSLLGKWKITSFVN